MDALLKHVVLESNKILRSMEIDECEEPHYVDKNKETFERLLRAYHLTGNIEFLDEMVKLPIRY